MASPKALDKYESMTFRNDKEREDPEVKFDAICLALKTW